MTCPDPRELRDLVSQRLPDAAALGIAHHLEKCAACRERMDTLTETGDLAADEPREHSAALRNVMQRLQRNRDSRLTFLRATERPGALGRFGPYDVIEVLGQGGMGIVLRAHDPQLDREVAIKLLLPELAAQPEARQRFLREAQAAARVAHDHIVTIHAVDEIDGLPCIVMRHIVGPSLEKRVERGARMGIDEIVRIASETAQGLAGAHRQGLVHRDIKPGNILLETKTGRVKIADFGLAKVVDEVGLTQPGTIAGTPQYMAPEQALAQDVDHRADLFALGSVLYFMCTSRPPFDGDSLPAVVREVCDEEPLAIRKINPDVPAWLIDVIERLMAKDPERRFATADEVVAALDRRPPAAPAPVEQSVHVGWVAGGVAVFLAVALAAWLMRGGDRATATTDGAFVVNGSRYATLAAAVDAAPADAVVEVHGRGPFRTDTMRLERPLTIRAVDGSIPVLALNGKPPLFDTKSRLTLEGLELRLKTAVGSGDPDPSHCAVRLMGDRAVLQATHCEFAVGAQSACVSIDGGAATLRNSRLGVGLAVFVAPGSKCRVTASNCVVSGRAGFMVGIDGTAAPSSIELDRVTVDVKMGLQLRVSNRGRPRDKALDLAIKRSVVQTDVLCIMQRQRASGRRTPTASDARGFLKDLMRWSSEGSAFFVAEAFGAMMVGRRVVRPAFARDVAGWRSIWDLPEGPGEKPSDAGADVNRVGPGPAYLAWKQGR